MKKVSLFDVCKSLATTIQSSDFLDKARKCKNSFIRKRKMPICDMMYFMMSCKNRRLQSELDEYFTKKGSDPVTRQAFSTKREYIKHEAFIDLNDVLVRKFENEDGEIATYRGYRLFGVDGTIVDLPNNAELRDYFGFSSNGTDKILAKGLGMTVFDVLNKITLFAELYRCDDSENKRIHSISDRFAELYNEKNIWLLDRGYPSFNLFKKFEDNKQNYLVRVSSSFLTEVNAANEPDQIVTVTRKSKTIKLRVINIELSSGITEKLVTNVFEDFSVDDFKELYAKRWGIETNYMFLKHKVMVEVFTGESVTAVLQDFHASILILNIAAIAAREQDDILNENNAICASGKNKGCKYRPNKTELIAIIKRDFVKLMLCRNILNRVFKQFLLFRNIKRYAYLDIPNRKSIRNRHFKNNHRTSHSKSPL